MSDDMQEEFEREFQAFVERGGLDEVQVINETYEVMRRKLTCPHGELPRNCGLCNGIALDNAQKHRSK